MKTSPVRLFVRLPGPERVAAERERDLLVVPAALAVLAIHDPRLVRDGAPTRPRRADARPRPAPGGPAFAHAMDHRIVRKALELDGRELPDHPRIEPIMQEQVGEAWGDRAALRRALDPRDQGSIGPLHRGLQPALHVHQDPFLVGVARDRLQHQVPRNGVKEGSDVKIDNPVLLETPLPADRDRVHGRAPGTIAVGVLVEHRLHAGLQRHRRRRLARPGQRHSGCRAP